MKQIGYSTETDAYAISLELQLVYTLIRIQHQLDENKHEEV